LSSRGSNFSGSNNGKSVTELSVALQKD